MSNALSFWPTAGNGGRLAYLEEHSGLLQLRLPALPGTTPQGDDNAIYIHKLSKLLSVRHNVSVEDADIRLFCVGDMVAFAGAGSSALVIQQR